MNATYFGETLEGTGQAEDYRLKLSPRKASNYKTTRYTRSLLFTMVYESKFNKVYENNLCL